MSRLGAGWGEEGRGCWCVFLYLASLKQDSSPYSLSPLLCSCGRLVLGSEELCFMWSFLLCSLSLLFLPPTLPFPLPRNPWGQLGARAQGLGAFYRIGDRTFAQFPG